MHIWDGYVQYPHHPKHCDQALRETPECVNPAEYVQYRRVRPSVTAAGTGLGVGGWVSGTLNTPAPMGAPGPPQGRGFSHFLGL